MAGLGCTENYFTVAYWRNYGSRDVSVDVKFQFLHGILSDPSSSAKDGETYVSLDGFHFEFGQYWENMQNEDSYEVKGEESINYMIEDIVNRYGD